MIALSGVDNALLDRLRTGARVVGANEVLRCGLEPGPVPELLAVDSVLRGGASVLFVVPGLSGAVLAGGGGYALVAGTASFLSGAVPEGVDDVRARFGRTARRLAGRYPELPGIAAEYPPVEHAWAKRSEVPAGTGVGQQLAAMESFARGELSGPEFARIWYAAWQLSRERRERLRDPFERILSGLFLALEDYPIDPALREQGDLTDDELVAEVRAALHRLA
ncbi:colicin immunity domain-containing protein [Amycolatopsis sp. NPDC054798]